MNKHIEVHVILDPHEANMLLEAGMPDPSSSCAHCDAALETIEYYAPRALVITENDHWTICLGCAAPVM